jgi:hypothetical protein
MKILLHCGTCYIRRRTSGDPHEGPRREEGRMNTRMLLTAVMRNRRSQWTLLPKADEPGTDAAEDDAEPTALRPSGEPSLAGRSREPASRNG